MFNIRKTFAALAAAAVACGLAGAALAAPRPFTAKDMAMMDRVSDPRLSPDGRFLVWTVRATDWKANKGETSLWLMDARTPAMPARKLAISAKGASSPRWSADGKGLYFLSARTGSQQVWRTDSDGLDAVQVTNLPVDVAAFRLSPDGKTLVIGAEVFADCADLACTKTRLDDRKAGGVSGATYDRLPFVVWDNWMAGTQAHLFALKLDASGAASGAPVPLMKGFDGDAPTRPFGDDGDFAIVGGGKSVVFAAMKPGEAWGVSEDTYLWSVPLDGSAPPRPIGPTKPGSYGGPVASPDGTRLAFTGHEGTGGEEGRRGVYVLDVASGGVRELGVGYDRSADSVNWSADGRALYVTYGDTGEERLATIDASGKVTAMAGGRHGGDLTVDSGVVNLTTGGHVGAVTVGGGRVVYSLDSLGSGAQLYELAKAGPPRQLTSANAELMAQAPMSPYEAFTFAGWNGESVHGYVVKPYGFQAGHKYPVAFLIHGGPHGTFGDAWSYRWNPQVWAGLGYAVVMIDFHGSSGYGEAFAQSIVQHWGDRPLEDLQKGWAAAQARYPWLDADHACALGGSYGGYMVAWIAGAWNAPWKCLVDHDGVFDTRSMAYSTDIPGFAEHETGGFGWEHAAQYETFNPVARIGEWKTPMLVIHGGRDYRVPIDQGLGAFTAAQRKGVASQLLYFPDENHWVLKPQNSVEWYRVVGAWMGRWTGNTSPPAAAPAAVSAP